MMRALLSDIVALAALVIIALAPLFI